MKLGKFREDPLLNSWYEYLKRRRQTSLLEYKANRIRYCRKSSIKEKEN